METVFYWIKGFNFSKLFQISHDCVPENACCWRIFGKICLKSYQRHLFSNMWKERGWRRRHEGKGGLNFWVRDKDEGGGCEKGDFRNFGYEGGGPMPPPPLLVGNTVTIDYSPSLDILNIF